METPSQDVLSLQAKASAIGIPAARRHVFMCCEPVASKCCELPRSVAAWDYFKRRLAELGLSEQGGVLRSKVGCLRICTDGPIVVGIARDLTARKVVEEKLEHYTEQLEALVGQRTEKLRESEQRFRELAEMLPETVFEIAWQLRSFDRLF